MDGGEACVAGSVAGAAVSQRWVRVFPPFSSEYLLFLQLPIKQCYSNIKFYV
jgi:hypothetical protein